MELTLKHKIAVFAVMAAVFICSIFLKHWLFSGEGSYSPGTEITVTAEASGSGDIGENPVTAIASGEEYSIIIDVEGAVTYPGIVRLEDGSRVYEAVEKAGGLLETADTRYVNLADFVKDGSIIYIPFEGENETASEGAAGVTAGFGAGTAVNINTADLNQLVSLPGIGETYAQAIIDYRNTSGFFQKPEDIMNVSGIGEAKYEKIKDLICVY